LAGRQETCGNGEPARQDMLANMLHWINSKIPVLDSKILQTFYTAQILLIKIHEALLKAYPDFREACPDLTKPFNACDVLLYLFYSGSFAHMMVGKGRDEGELMGNSALGIAAKVMNTFLDRDRSFEPLFHEAKLMGDAKGMATAEQKKRKATMAKTKKGDNGE